MISTDRIARDVAFTLEKKSPKIFENIFLQNGVLVLMGSKGRVKIVKGSNRFDERVHLGQNSTVDTRSKFAQIPTDMQNNFQTATYGQSVISGSAVINLVERDQNMGTYKISSMAEALIEETQNTFANKVSDKLMQATSGSNDPLSIVEEIEATAYGSQTGSLGGLKREDYTGADATEAWQNQYSSSAISDISGAAGIAAFTKFLWDCSPGGSNITEQPDIVLTTTGVFAKATGGGDVLRRYTVNEKMLNFGFDNIMFNKATVIADRSVTAGYAYALNTNYLRIQVLGGEKTKVIGNVKTVGDGKQSIPLQIRPMQESDDFLNFIVKMYLVYNLTFGGLRQHGLQVSITEA